MHGEAIKKNPACSFGSEGYFRKIFYEMFLETPITTTLCFLNNLLFICQSFITIFTLRHSLPHEMCSETTPCNKISSTYIKE